MKIDIHTHIMPEHMPNWTKKFGYGEFIHLEHKNCEACMMKADKLFRVVEKNCFKDSARIKDMDEFNENKASEYMKNMKKVMIHTGSLKILDGFKKLYNLDENQIKESYETLQEFGNLTGCSIPTVLEKSFSDMNPTERGLLIGITMGFGLDMVEIEKV